MIRAIRIPQADKRGITYVATEWHEVYNAGES